MPTRGRVAPRLGPAPQLGRQIAVYRTKSLYVFKTFDLSFMFHFYVSTYWISIISENETYDFNVSFLVSCFTFQNTVGALSRSHSVFESLPQCFEIAPSVFLNRSHSVFVFLPQCFLNETLKLKMKHKSRIFQPSKVLIINKLKHKNETWKQKTS